ncbi:MULTISPECIES: glycosyl hydrolase family 18 protein [unclassified Streptomyces]|uniref:glycosyl hydrolase family 18 protein n=1 Tax=unclassified Streptomyces TaxID=2593676 RepID=UPI002E28E4EE|nr:glycosyl hydrolase family 18 protein [Streptomyces sp. NBC_00223]
MARLFARWRLLAVAVVAALGAGLLVAPPATAVIGDKPLITYNMQGASTGVDSKWTTTIRNYAMRAEIVALQEAGASPPGDIVDLIHGAGLANSGNNVAANLREDRLPQAMRPTGVRHSLWNTGAGAFDIYFLQTDRNGQSDYHGGRVNVAMVTQRAADDVAALPNPFYVEPDPQNGVAGTQGPRATLGLRFGDTWYFTLHALSGGGNDAPGLLANISAFVTGRGLGEHWIALGDFNRTPGSLGANIPGGARIYASGVPTQQSGNELDYAVSSQNQNGVQVNRMAGASSDHYAVNIGQLRAAAEPTPMFTERRTIESVQSGGLIDAKEGGTAVGTQIVSSRRNGADNQSWTIDAYNDNSIRIRGKQSNRCLLPQQSGSSWSVKLDDCGDSIWERFRLEYMGNDEYQVHSEYDASLCLNVKGGQTDPSTVKDVILWECQNTPNERWMFTPAEASVDADTSAYDLRESFPNAVVLESLKAGGVASAKDAGTTNGTKVVSFHRTGYSNQGMLPVWLDGVTAVFKATAAPNLCLDVNGGDDSVAAGKKLELDVCDNHDSQQWVGERLLNSTVLLHNRAAPDLCMDIAGSPDNPNNGDFDVENCTATASQQIIFGSFDPTGVPEPDQDWGRDGSDLSVIPDPGAPAQRTAYFPSWSVYANEFYVKNLDTEGIAGRLTTLTYAFENIDPVDLTCFAANQAGSSDESDTTGNDGASDAWADYQMGYTADNSIDGTADAWDQPLKGNFNQLKKLKAKYPNLKVTVSLGGWTYAKYFSDVAATEASRQKFVSSCIDMYIKGNLPQLGDDPAGGTGVAAGIFDGFDIDWEFPGSENGHAGNHISAQDTENFTLLLAEFRHQLDALGQGHYQLTAALPSGPADIDKIDVGSLGNSLDMADIMTYDMHGAWETEGPTNFQAPLYDSPASPAAGIGFTANDAVDNYLIHGLPASKLSLGVPLYGRGWTGVPEGGTDGLYQSATGPTDPFPYSQQDGVAMYKELEAAGKLVDLHYDPQTKSSWVYDGTNFWSIESPDSLTAKRQYIKDRHLGGIMMYSLEADDANATLVTAATGLIPAP